ncbi:MAG: Ni/Fe-hydrogenase cytochrome b subunit [Candidatus Eisenbacteria sp.]|nr:Ni/Fe-hydrogenase cytochrome b subunit [Candidatus Eisenbacteria bacterium]
MVVDAEVLKLELRKRLTPGWFLVGIILLGGLIIAVRRFACGLGAVTNLSDQIPWGFWIGFDVVSGVALAAGGFTMAFIVHIAGDKAYRPLVRPAILTAFLGYIIVIVGLLFDLGRPWNIWRAIFWWNPHSVMFEVAWCVMLYTTVLFLELLPVVFEGLRAEAPLRMMRRIAIPLYIVGIILSTLHQSSLGSLFLIVPTKLHPLWYTPMLPVLFFLSALTVGAAMVIFEAFLSSKLMKRGLELELLSKLGRYLAFIDLFYVIVKVQDLGKRGAWGHAFTGSYESIFFIVEMLLFILPLFVLFNARARMQRSLLFTSALMVVLGLVLNRINVSLVGIIRGTGGSYFPNWQEFWISAFVVVAGALVFGLITRFLPVFPKEEAEPGKASVA